MSRRPLRLVNPETGEITDEACPNCADLTYKLEELTRKYHGSLSQIGRLRADKGREARAHELFPTVKELFDYWRDRCKHPGSKFTPERFWQAVDIVEEYGEAACRRAIDGAAYDPWITKRKNGSEKRHDAWDLVFKSSAKMEDFANRAPRSRAASLLSVELPPGEKTLAGMSAVTLDE